MQLSGPRIERLQQALLSAYPRLEHVLEMVSEEPDASLDAGVPLHRHKQSDTMSHTFP